MDQIIISTKLLNNVLQYLGSRPFAEVFQMIEAIQKEASNQPSKDEPLESIPNGQS